MFQKVAVSMDAYLFCGLMVLNGIIVNAIVSPYFLIAVSAKWL